MSINVTNGNYLLNGNPIGGAGLEGTQYILVQANGTDIENAQELQEAYDLAKTMSPDVDNRITVIVAPGNYNFGSSIFVMDTEHIDLVSLNGTMSIIFNSTDNDGTISVETGNTFIKGVDVLTKPFKIGHDLNSLVVENCKGGDNSFGYLDDGVTLTLRGTFIDCVAGNNSFGHRPNIGGSSQINLNINGTFTNCIAGDNSFGNGTDSLTLGTFTNCVGGLNSFGGDGGSLEAKLYRCQLTNGTFETPTGSGKIVLGIDGDDNVINLTA